MEAVIPTLGVVSIATRDYLQFWKAQAASVDRHTQKANAVSLYLFTDKVQEAEEFSQTLRNVSVKVFQIPSLGWPDATLLRYRIISQAKEALEGEDLLMYLDSDMLVVDLLDLEELRASSARGMALVKHPCFFRHKGLTGLVDYLKHPKVLLGDLLMLVTRGGLGSWETRPSSAAFVQRSNRESYFCGGIWWGTSEIFLKFADDLRKSVDIDLSRDLTAVFHDESHLNMWAVNNPHSAESPEYCFVDSFTWLQTLNPKIKAVEKGIVDRRA
jgi:hypothetical protein